jgi:hypothetical protein
LAFRLPTRGDGGILFLLASHLLCGDGLLFLLDRAIGFGLFLGCLLAYCFRGLVAHDVAFRLIVCSPAAFETSPKGISPCPLIEGLASNLSHLALGHDLDRPAGFAAVLPNPNLMKKLTRDELPVAVGQEDIFLPRRTGGSRHAVIQTKYLATG